MAERAPGRRLGRRRRRLYWTAAILLVVGTLGAAWGLAVYRASRPAGYRPGEEHEEITRGLDRDRPAEAPVPRFTDVTSAAGLGEYRAFAGARSSQLPEDMGPGAAWGDVDGDGDEDLFVVAAGGSMDDAPSTWARSRLYLNDGAGRFAESSSFPETRILGMGAAFGDVDDDGDLDLVVSGYDALRLFLNRGDGTWERDPRFSEPSGYWSGLSWADYDLDGDLDLYVCGYVRYAADTDPQRTASIQYGRSVPYTLNPASFAPERNLLLRNRGDGRFDEVAASLGVDNPQGRSLSALWHDLDGDGRLDLYVANDISDNALFLNREDGFEDASHPAWVADYRGAMGLAAGDWNRDGDDDVFVTHWIAQENALYDSLWGDLVATEGGERRALRFMDVADQRGLGQIALQRIGWGTEFADLDGDGWLDLVVANGSTFETGDDPPKLRAQPPFLFWNQRGRYFHDLAPELPTLSQPRVGRGLTTADYDRDGDLDLLLVDREAGVLLLRNEMQSGNWIELRLFDESGRTTGAVGARVEASVTIAGEMTVLRRAVNSVSYLSQSSSILHLGLGDASAVSRLEVIWPDGRREIHEGLGAGRTWDLREGAAPGNGPGDRRSVAEFWRLQREAMHAFKVENDPTRAIPLFERALAIEPGHGDSLYYLANSLAETGDVTGALERLTMLVERDPMSHRAYKRWGVLRALTASDDDGLREARAALQRAIEINPEETGALHALGEVDLLLGDTGAAERHFSLEIRTNPQSRAGRFLLAYARWKGGDEAGAQEALRQAVEATQEHWIPPGAVAEGETRASMHTEAAPLERWTRVWDGALEPSEAFSELDRELGRRGAGRD